MDLKLISYNCKGFSINKVPFINSLLDDCDILLLRTGDMVIFKSVCAFQKYFANRESHSIMWNRRDCHSRGTSLWWCNLTLS